jgi:hypothetical protein
MTTRLGYPHSISLFVVDVDVNFEESRRGMESQDLVWREGGRTVQCSVPTVVLTVHIDPCFKKGVHHVEIAMDHRPDTYSMCSAMSAVLACAGETEPRWRECAPILALKFGVASVHRGQNHMCSAVSPRTSVAWRFCLW